MFLILLGGHLATAPRPQKEAAAAKAAGFDVHVRGVWWDDELATEDRAIAQSLGIELEPVVDLRCRDWRTILFRLQQRAACEVCRSFGIVSVRALGMAGPELLKEAIRLRPTLTMVHSEAGLWVGEQLLNRGWKVGVDFEDWFSEDLPAADRVGRPVAAIKLLERKLLNKANLTITTTQAMADAMAIDAGCKRVPFVIPNSFPFRDLPASGTPPADPRSETAVSFYWFSQTIGPGRGLESLAKALPLLKGEWELHLRGNLRDYRPWFEQHFGPAIRDRVLVHQSVPNRDLARQSASHDVGLALEVPLCRSRDLTATNKLFEYLRCGLAVIASSTKGQLEVMQSCPNAGWIIPPDDADALVSAMQCCVDNSEALAEKRRAAQVAGRTVWDWDAFASVLGAELKRAAFLEA